jgi:hypothetical protein
VTISVAHAYRMRYVLIMKTTTKFTETLAQKIARLDHEYDRVKRLEREQADAAAAKEGAK